MMSTKKIIIIGGGISGVACALALSKAGFSSVILEGEKEVLKKVLATGNGRCNFTNENMVPECYYGDAALIENTLSSYTVEDALNYFDSMGVRYRNVGGYYYPYSNQASTVRNAFTYQLKEADIDIITEAKVCDIKPCNEGFIVYYNDVCINADYVVIAAGGKVGVGCSGFSEKLRALGVDVSETYPALVGLRYKDSSFSNLNGVRARCEVAAGAKSEIGEVQFGKDYISGIPVMNLSHLAAKEDQISLNLLPELSYDEAINEAEKRLNSFKNKRFALSGLMNDKLYDLLKPVISGDDNHAIAKAFVKAAMNVKVKVAGTLDYDRAQVTAGGVVAKELELDFSLKKYPGLYVVGEACDVDGICGGYNIHFAIASGIQAAKSISEKIF